MVITVALFIQSASAAVYYLNGTVNASDTTLGLSGVTVTGNTTNTTTTNANGFWSLANNNNGTVSLTFKANGYTTKSNNTLINAASNFSNQTLTIITPTLTVAESSVTRNAATLTATITATDTVNNNYVGTRVRYSKDSGLANSFTTSWTNTSATPAFTLSNLDLGVKWYYSVDTYNSANGSYTASSTGDFTTLKGAYDETRDLSNVPLDVQIAQQNQAGLVGASILNPQTPEEENTRNRNIIVFILVVGLVYVLFFTKK